MILAAAGAGAAFCPAFALRLPGSQLALFLTSGGNLGAAFCLTVFTLVLVVPDYILTRCATYSGIGGTLSQGGRIASTGSLLSVHSSWPDPHWRISLLGWLRNRNAVMLFAWGALYGFFYMYFSRPDETFSYITFSWMMLVFHSYLRGNLLGVDHRAVWAYYMVPLPVQDVIRAKNRTLTLLQGCMVTAVLLPAVFHPVPGMGLSDWTRIGVGAYSSLLLGEISGTILSFVKNPLYIGSILITAGFCILADNIYLLAAAFFMFCFHYIPYKKRVEGDRLMKIFGKPYAEYDEAVPEYLPRWAPYPHEKVSWQFKCFIENSEEGILLMIIAGIILILSRPFWRSVF